LNFFPKNKIEINTQVQLNVGVNKIVWSHKNKNIVLCNCDDNVFRLFDLKNIECMYDEIFLESKIMSMDWDKISNDKILVGGNKNESTIYNLLDDDEKPIIHNHEGDVLDSQWSTHYPNQFLSSDNSGKVYLWNEKNKESQISFKLENDNCAVGLDLNIQNENLLALSCIDSKILIYDLRNTKKPKSFINDPHNSYITKIKWSPHTQHLLATSSCDRTLKIWNFKNDNEKENNEGKMSNFKNQKMEDWVNGLDWNVHEVGLISLCCNDQLVKAYNIRED